MHKSALFMALLIALLLVGYLGYRHYVKARALLQAWADANGYKILHARRSNLLMPLAMYFSTSKYQVVYHVAVFDASIRRIRSAWVRLGTYWTGAMDGDAVDVKWEHEDPA